MLIERTKKEKTPCILRTKTYRKVKTSQNKRNIQKYAEPELSVPALSFQPVLLAVYE